MKPLIFLLFIGLQWGVSGPGWAQDSEGDESSSNPWLSDRFIMSIGGFLPRKTIEISARGSAGADDFLIDFDDSFKGGEDQNVFAGNFHWRFGKKWWASAEYYGTNFREGATLEEDLEWNGRVFPAGSYATAGVETTIYRAVLGREIYSTKRSDLGLGLGIHWMDLSAYIEGELLVGDQTSGVLRESVSASAPLPNLSLWYIHAFSDKWALTGRFDWLSASYDEYSGSIRNYNVGINYQAFKHFGIGLMYKRFQIDVDVDKDDWYGAVRMTHTGPFISINTNW